MRAKQFIPEAAIGTNPRRPAREGSRPIRGHETEPRYKELDKFNSPEEFAKDANYREYRKGLKASRKQPPKPLPEAEDKQPKRTHTNDCGSRSGHDCDCKGTLTHANSCGSRYGHDCDCGLDQARKQGVAEGNPWANVIHTTDIHAEKEQRELKNKQAVADSAKVLKNHAKALEPKEIELIKKYNLFHRGRMPEGSYGRLDDEKAEKLIQNVLRFTETSMEEQFCNECGGTIWGSISEHGKASRELCKSSKPDNELGASMLSSCKSQGLRARDGDKSHKLGKTAKSRVKVGGHRIKGRKYGGPLPDWS